MRREEWRRGDGRAYRGNTTTHSNYLRTVAYAPLHLYIGQDMQMYRKMMSYSLRVLTVHFSNQKLCTVHVHIDNNYNVFKLVPF